MQVSVGSRSLVSSRGATPFRLYERFNFKIRRGTACCAHHHVMGIPINPRMISISMGKKREVVSWRMRCAVDLYCAASLLHLVVTVRGGE